MRLVCFSYLENNEARFLNIFEKKLEPTLTLIFTTSFICDIYNI